MELGKQIKTYRMEQNLSQDELAERVFVTRQTISNWENDRNYPDIRSLVLLSNVFGVSLDTLVKGDLDTMKEAIKEEDVRKFSRDSNVLAVMMVSLLLLAVPLIGFLKWVGIGIWAALWAVTMIWAIRVEKQKKAHNIQTYKEIVTFLEKGSLNEAEKNQEIGKRPYQKVLGFVLGGVVGIALMILITWVV